MTTDEVKTFLHRWRALLATLVAMGTVVIGTLTWGSDTIAWFDKRYVARGEINYGKLNQLAQVDLDKLARVDPDKLVTKQDLRPIKNSIAFIERSYIQDKITQLDSRIQVLESVDLSRDSRQTLNELKLERSQLRFRLELIDRNE